MIHMLIRCLFLLAGLSLALPAMAELVSADPKVLAMIKQARSLAADNKYNEALALYRSAAAADPTASQATSSIAMLFATAATMSTGKDAATYREQAAGHARAALAIDARDPMAQEVLRGLADEVAPPQQTTTPEAQRAISEGEALFHDKKYAQALQKYEAAARLDPNYAIALLYIGDCYFMQDDLVRAEEHFRKAVALDPLLGSGWRFLFDTLVKQNKFQDAQVAAVAAVAAMPSANLSWARVRMLAEREGQAWHSFVWEPKARVTATNKITMEPDQPKSDGAIWLAYALSQLPAKDSKEKLSPFAAELAAWNTTAQIIMETGGPDKLHDENLRALARFHQAGQLKAALFALNYKEAYRAEFEAWKKAEPDGLKRFIDTFHTGL